MEEQHAVLGDSDPLSVEPRSPMAFDYRSAAHPRPAPEESYDM
jgi:hypothetical protein